MCVYAHYFCVCALSFTRQFCICLSKDIYRMRCFSMAVSQSVTVINILCTAHPPSHRACTMLFLLHRSNPAATVKAQLNKRRTRHATNRHAKLLRTSELRIRAHRLTVAAHRRALESKACWCYPLIRWMGYIGIVSRRIRSWWLMISIGYTRV